ncbi:putative RNA-directed DNA polymerase [Helianthus annuus]|nr:putative RNA-directed DNA polymerase [Helianthus annuus]
MASGSMKDMMTSKANKLEKFEGVDFRRWQKKTHFLLTSLKVVYVLTTPIPVIQEEGNLEQIRKRSKWENDNYICLGHILNGMSDPLFDVYQNVETAKLLWDTLEAKYMAEDSSSKKFIVSNFNNYRMVDERPVMEQYLELLRLLGQFAQHDMKMDESISVSSIIDKLPPSWRDVKHNLKHQKGELTLVELGSHLRIEEGLRAQENVLVNDDKKRVGSSSVNMVETGESSKGNSKFKGKRKFQGNNNSGSNKKPNYPCWKCDKVGHFKRDCKMKKNNNKSGSKNKNEASSSRSKDPGKQG